MKKKCIYPGSFDPFTNGHLDIVKKASVLFDEVHVVIGNNTNKNRSFDCYDMQSAMQRTFEEEGLDNCKVSVCTDLVAKYAKENHIKYMIRGLRNNMDYNYEENIAEVNKLIYQEVEYVYFRAENIALSSSMVKELYSFGHDVSGFLPKNVLDVLKK